MNLMLAECNYYVILLFFIFINLNNGDIVPPDTSNSIDNIDIYETDIVSPSDNSFSTLSHFREDNDSDSEEERCSNLGDICQGCCRQSGVSCWQGICLRCQINKKGTECISQEALIFVTASQVALVTALVMAVTALIALLYRTCIKTRFLRNRRANAAATPPIRIPAEPRVSLTSLQQRVVTRLRDRPPGYETQRNYDYQQSQSRDENTATPNNTVSSAVLIDPPRSRTMLPGEPPPCYDENTEAPLPSVRGELPPPYSISVITTSDNSSIIQDITPNENGITNNSFVSDNDDKIDKENIENDGKVIHI